MIWTNGMSVSGQGLCNQTLTGLIISVNGTFTVDCSLFLKDCHVYLEDGAKIIVQQSALFRLYNNTIFESCDGINMWDGIYVYGPYNPIAANGLEVLSGSKIMDAENAVVSINGGRFYFNNATFDLNYRHVVVQPYASAHPALVQNTLFTCSNQASMKAPFQNQETLKSFDISSNISIQIGDPTSITLKNTIEKCRCGIMADKTNLKVYNNDFLNIQFIATPDGEQILGTGVAIYTTGFTGQLVLLQNIKTLVVGGTGTNQPNNFLECFQDVEVNCNQNVYVINNQITNSRHYGIFISNCRLTTIHVNDNIFNKNPHAILLVLVPGCQVQVNDNKYTYNLLNPYSQCFIVQGVLSCGPIPGKAIEVKDVNYSSGALNTDIHIDHNDIEVYGHGIWVQGARNVNILNQIQILLTPFSSFPITVNDKNFYAIRCEGSLKVRIENNQNLKANFDPNHPFQLSPFSNGIYGLMCPGEKVSCNNIFQFGSALSCVGNMPGTSLLNNTMNTAIRGLVLENTTIGNQGAANAPSDNKWMGNFSQWQTWKNTTASTFFYVRNGANYLPTNNGVGPLSWILFQNANGLLKLCPALPLVSSSQILLDIAQDQIIYTDWIPENKGLASTYLYDCMRHDSLLLVDSVLSAWQTSQTGTSFESLQKVEGRLADADFTTARIMNPSVVPTCIIEVNEKTVNEIYLANFADTIIPVDSSDLAILKSIADQCPFTGGYAVFNARVLIFAATGIDQDYVDNCGTNSNKTNENEAGIETENSKVILYPNPSNEELYISGTQNIDKADFYDEFGRLVISSKPENNRVDTKSIQSGIYFVRLISSSGFEIPIEKVAIIH